MRAKKLRGASAAMGSSKQNLCITALNLSVSRGEDRIFEGVSFNLNAGEALLITGPNGVGKSTLIRALAGFLPLDGGEISIDGEKSHDHSKPLSEYCHYIGHKNAMKDELTVFENLVFWQKTFGGDKDGVMSPDEAADQLGLAHTLELPFGILSQGQRRRIALAKLFVAHRPLWLLDEPTAALDKKSADLFAELTNQYLRNGGMVIAATHDPLAFQQAKTLEMTPVLKIIDADVSYF